MARRQRRIAVSILKGGAGKTTTAVNLAAAVCRLGRRVLLVDTDPQGGVAASLGIPNTRGLAEWLPHDGTFLELVQKDVRPCLDVLAAGALLSEAEEELHEKGVEKRLTRLRKRMDEIDALEAALAYDLVLFDTAPSAGLLTENVYLAAQELLVPVKLDPLTLPALDRTRAFLAQMNERREKGDKLRIAGVVPTFYDLRTHLSEEVLGSLKERFGRVLSPIRINSALAAAPGQGGSIYDLDGSARGAVDYALLAEDLHLA